MAGIDALLGASVNAVKKSGVIEGSALMATVTVVNSDGTITAARGADSYPKVRVLSGYLVPTVGDVVELLRAAGGWVCIGKLMTSSAPRIQSGQVSVAIPTANKWYTAPVVFPKAFASTPIITATPASGIATDGANLSVAIYGESATGFTMNVNRGTAATTFVNWIATTF
ncbi:hypothetical protein [Streptomyces sp. NPDC055006]